MRPWPRIGVVAAGLLWRLGCGDGTTTGGRDRPRPQGDARLGGQVISTVDGVAITVGDVGRLAEAERITPREALRRLQDDLILAAEAERRGLGDDRRVEQDARRAEVQA